MGKRKFETGDVVKINNYSIVERYGHYKLPTHVINTRKIGNTLYYVLDLQKSSGNNYLVQARYADLVTDNEEVIAYEESRLTTTREPDRDADLQGSSTTIPQPTA